MGKRNLRHSIETKKAALAEYYGGTSVAEICRKYEISSGLFYNWKRLYDKGILTGNPNKEAQLVRRGGSAEGGKSAWQNWRGWSAN